MQLDGGNRREYSPDFGSKITKPHSKGRTPICRKREMFVVFKIQEIRKRKSQRSKE